MLIIRQYEELSLADKVYHLHVRHIQDIKELLQFMNNHISWLLEKPDRINIKCPCNDGPAWTEILPILQADITNECNNYIEEPAMFIQTFTKGKNHCFFLHCIRRFRDLTPNPIFKKAIQYWLDC